MSRKASPPAVEDLSSRRLQKIADENRELRDYLADVMKRLRENERLFARLFELESKVLAATDPEDLCFSLLRGLRAGFSLDMVRLWLDRSSFIGHCNLQGLSERDLVWLEQGEIAGMGLPGRHVWLLQMGTGKDFSWLTPQDAHLGSLALLVLGQPDRPFGVLGLGSIDKERFSPEQSTDFLQNLAQIVGLSLENSVARERLARLSMTDTLTGAHNRRFLQPHSHQPLSQWFGKKNPVACLYFDVDNLKVVNDQLGHAAGDDLLSTVSRVVRGCIRAQDPLIRVGGDEFVLLLPGCTIEKAEEVAHNMIRRCFETKIGEFPAAVSVGLAWSAPEQDLSVRDLIKQADEAMYVAKALGGSRLEKAISKDREA